MSHAPVAQRSHATQAFLIGVLLLGIAVTSHAQTAPWLVLPGPAGGYVEVPHAAELSPAEAITIEMWVYLVNGFTPEGQDSPTLLGKNLNNGYWFGVVGRRLRFHFEGITFYREGEGLVPIGEWAHVAVTYDGSTVAFYINGDLDAEHTDAEGVIAASSSPLRIASDRYFGRSPFGAIDEVRLWNVARTESEIAGAMDTTITTPEEGLVAVWNFDGDLADPVGNHDGTLSGDAELGSTVPEIEDCPYEYFLPGAAHARGEYESQWRSDLTLFNASGSDAQAELHLLLRNADNSAPEWVTVSVPRRTSVVLTDVILSRFGYDNLAGALRICSDLPLQIRMRTYNQSEEGTFGQGIPAVRAADAYRTGYLIALYENDQYRTNIGFVNTSPNLTTVKVDYYDGNGAKVGTWNYDLEPYGHNQVGRAFRFVTQQPIANGRVWFSSSAADVIVYASVGDNDTSDGTYLSPDE